MKKLLIALILLLTLTLSGCGTTTEPPLEYYVAIDLENNRLYYNCNTSISEKSTAIFGRDFEGCDGYVEIYTQEEVDELIDNLTLYTTDEIPCIKIDDNTWECEQFVKLGDTYYITTNTSNDIKSLLSYIQELEQRIDELENNE